MRAPIQRESRVIVAAIILVAITYAAMFPGSSFCEYRSTPVWPNVTTVTLPGSAQHEVLPRMGVHITLRNGFDLTCTEARPLDGKHVRLMLHRNSEDFLDVVASDIVSAEPAPEPQMAVPAAEPVSAPEMQQPNFLPKEPTRGDIMHMAAEAGSQHQLDPDLIASVIAAESGFHSHAVSRAGAQGLMQLMPRTAEQLGVTDSFHPQQNVAAGTAYLDQLLLLYHDNVAWALAAYNAGPAAVAKYHGIPPYNETRRYVARVIHDFNRRKLMAVSAVALQP